MRKCLVLGVWCLVLGCFSSFAADEVRPRVNITSQPSGATVIVDGMDRGTTPVMLFDLAPGRHHLKYRLAGYVERDRFFNTNENPGPYIEKNEVLEEEKGLLLLKTDPEGCDIQIDGDSVGQTPRLFTHLSVNGTYNVKFRKAGYQDQTISVKFEGRKPLVREEKMVLASGTIGVHSEPGGAEVTVNGIVRGRTPVELTEIIDGKEYPKCLKVTGVPSGRAVVKFRLDGFVEEVRELAIKAGDVQALPIVLKGLPGTLQLASVPDGARFYVNNEAKGKGPLTIAGLQPGDYTVRAELEGYGTMTKTIRLDNGQSASEEFQMSNVMGRIEVRSNPVGAQVFLDGKLCGMTKSKDPDAEYSDIFPIENVLEGEHTLVLKMDGYADLTRHPKIKNSTTSKQHRMTLNRIFTPDVEIVTSRGSYQGVLVKRSGDFVTIEVRPGIMRDFSQDEIRKINFLKTEK